MHSFTAHHRQLFLICCLVLKILNCTQLSSMCGSLKILKHLYLIFRVSLRQRSMPPSLWALNINSTFQCVSHLLAYWYHRFWSVSFQAAWKELKTCLPLAFMENLNNYNVDRFDRARVTQPTLAEIKAGWKLTSAAHLEGEAVEGAESQQMSAYYCAKAHRWSSKYLPK
jgi:hypothetical protein